MVWIVAREGSILPGDTLTLETGEEVNAPFEVRGVYTTMREDKICVPWRAAVWSSLFRAAEGYEQVDELPGMQPVGL